MAETGEYVFKLKVDNQQLNLDLAQAKKAFADLAKQAKKAGAVFDDIPNPFDSLGKSAPKVEAAKKQFDALGMSVAQLARETPALAMGVNTYFMAISNNLPIFADAVKKVREENAALAAQGKPTVSVLKQIGSALINWQTLLIAVVTTLAMNGDKVWEWVKSLFKGKSAVDAVKEATEGLNAAIEKNGLGIGKELGKYEELRRKFVAINNDLAKQEDFVRDNQEAFDELGISVNDVVEAEAFFSGEGTEAFLTALRLRAEALAAQKLAVEQYESAIIAEQKKREKEAELSTIPEYKTTEWVDMDGRVHSSHSLNQDYIDKQQEISALDQVIQKVRSVADAYFDMSESARSAASDILESLGVAQSSEETRRAEELAQRKAEAEQKAAEARAEQIANTSARLIADARRAATQAEIDAMEDGIEKTIAQINHNYDLEEQTISKREEELKKLRGGRLTSQEEESFAQLRSANAAERDRSTNAAYAVLFAEADAWLEEANLEAEEAAEDINDVIAKRTKAWEDYRIKYGSIKERILATTQRYNRLIADAETEGQRMSLEAERDTLLAQYEVEASDWAKTLVDMTAEQLNTMVEELIAEVEAKEEAYQALDNTTGNDASEYRRQIATLRAQIAALREQLGKAGEAVSDDHWAEAITLFRGIGEAATEAADGISEFDGKLGFILKGIAELSSLSIDMIGALKGIKEAFEKTGDAMEKASAILAVISVAIKAVNSIFNIMQSNAEATRNATIAAYEYAQALDKISNAALRSTYNTIFGKDKYGEFTTLLNETQSQLQDIAKLRSDIAKTSDNAVYKLGQGASVWAHFGGLRGKINEGYAYDEALVADMRSGWQKFWGSGNDNIKYTSLDEFYENGKLNVDKLKAYYDTYKEYLTEEQADLVKSLLDTGVMFEQNMEAVNDYMRDIFGDLGASITDSLVDAFKNGTDAAIAMGDAVADVVEKIAVDMAHAAFIQPLLEQAQEGIDALNKQKMDGTLTDEEYMRQLMEITSTLMGNAQATGEDMNAYLEYIRQMADELGIDGVLDSDNKNTTYAKGFQAMSQETGSELNGRFTDIQGQTHRIAEAVEFCRGLQAQQAQHLQSVSSTLASIHNDTSLIAQHTKALARMDANLDAMRRAIDNGAI